MKINPYLALNGPAMDKKKKRYKHFIIFGGVKLISTCIYANR